MGNLRIFLDLLFNALFHAAFLIFFVGFIYKIYSFKTVPQPLKIPQTPQSSNLSGVISRMAGDVLIFRSLSKGTTILWFAGLAFHVTFFIIIIRHIRYFIYPVPDMIVWMGDFALPIGYILLISLLVLLNRRFTNKRVNFISSSADYFVLLLIIGIVITGILMRYDPHRPDLVEVKSFIAGLLSIHGMIGAFTMHPVQAPSNYIFLIHLLLVLVLLIFFPFSKLMHAGGYFFSPTRNQVNNPRDIRHINPWDKSESLEEGENG